MCFGIKLRQKLAGPQKSPASTLNPFLVIGHPSVPFPLRTGKALILKTFSFTKDLGQVAALSSFQQTTGAGLDDLYTRVSNSTKARAT